ncbi:MAG: hypothetical protein JWO30_4623 [Fibrobacteres bacterium]|nr:hypothetical protein [Fibrobacterota bacterium]
MMASQAIGKRDGRVTRSQGMFATLSDWLARTRKPVTWIYCSAVLFPLAFALVATLVTTARTTHASGSVFSGIVTSFYLILMVMLATVPRSVLPALLIWLLIARFRPGLDDNWITRYLGLVALLAIALYSHAKVYDRPFNFIWLSIATLAVVLPRLALPSLRDGLHKT